MTKPSNNYAQKMSIGVVGIWGAMAIALPALSQQQQINLPNSNSINPINPINRINPKISNFDGRVRSDNRGYPYGSKVFENGRISTSNNDSVYPSSTIRHGDGTTSYYYRDGSRITVNSTKISPSGTPIRK
jgi:hypothetical protein